MARLFDLAPGDAPLVISVPHAGTYVPPELKPRLSEAGRALADTDWHVDHLWRPIAAAVGATLIVATHSRYVIDLNRPEDGAPLYPGADETELCPTTTSAHAPIWLPGQETTAAEREARIAALWRPYHAALRAELDRVHARHGRAVLLDGHSIGSRVPRFFDGRLPDLNFGTNDGATAGPAVGAAIEATLAAAAPEFDGVRDGRFKGGHITRAYGQAGGPVESVQLELSWATYMVAERPPFALNPDTAERLRVRALAPLAERLIAAARA